MPREFDQGTIPGSDVVMDGYLEIAPLPMPEINWAGTDEWLPKTDWSCNGIIANEPG